MLYLTWIEDKNHKTILLLRCVYTKILVSYRYYQYLETMIKSLKLEWGSGCFILYYIMHYMIQYITVYSRYFSIELTSGFIYLLPILCRIHDIYICISHSKTKPPLDIMILRIIISLAHSKIQNHLTADKKINKNIRE